MKKVFSIILIFIMTTLCCMSVSAFQSAGTIEIGDVSSDIQSVVKPLNKKDWTVCVYLCGTDLESVGSAGTIDFLEMLAADIPDDINVLVMTGGAKQWNPYENDKVAIENGVVEEGAYIAPDKKITRLEMIVMLARFEEERGNILTATEPEHHLSDCDEIPDWGKSAVHWAVANGIIYGDNGSVRFDDYVKVNEAVAMISRCGNVSEE